MSDSDQLQWAQHNYPVGAKVSHQYTMSDYAVRGVVISEIRECQFTGRLGVLIEITEPDDIERFNDELSSFASEPTNITKRHAFINNLALR